MRYLTVVRHAKSSPARPGESDFARTLNKRGRDECERLREWANDPEELGRFGPTTALVSSAAVRARPFGGPFTGRLRRALRVQRADLQRGRDVSAEDLLIDLAAIDPVTTSLLVVGHNPTVHEVMIALAKELPKSLRGDHYPLGGAYVLALPDDRPVGLERYEVVASYIPV